MNGVWSEGLSQGKKTSAKLPKVPNEIWRPPGFCNFLPLEFYVHSKQVLNFYLLTQIGLVFFVFPHSKVLSLPSQSLTHLLVAAARVLPGGPHPHRQDEDVEEDDGGDARPVDHLLERNGGERTIKQWYFQRESAALDCLLEECTDNKCSTKVGE